MSHPYLCLIRSLGCADEAKIVMAFQSYLELKRACPTSDIQSFYYGEMDIIYLKCKQTHSTTEEVYIPISSEYQISPFWISNLQNQLSSAEDENSITLLIWDRDSSCVKYTLTKGMIPPSSPKGNKRKKEDSE